MPTLSPRIIAGLFVLLGSTTLPAETPAVAADRISALRAEIARYDALYFQQARAEVTDAAYDKLKRELATLEAAHPELNVPAPTIVDDRSGLFQSYRHRAPMLGLDKAYSQEELRTFFTRAAAKLTTANSAFVIEPKVDGVAVSVTYDHGKMTRAATRGNGVEGDDITAHARVIRSLPATLHGAPASWPALIELRGEIYVPTAEFNRINLERENAGEPPFAHPRNLAAGSLRQLDSSVVASRSLAVIFYGFAACEPAAVAPATQQALHAQLRAWGLPCFAEIQIARKPEEIWRAVNFVGQERFQFGFPIDGAVIKVDDVATHHALGASDVAPRWAMAYKFAPEQIETQLRSITIQVGRTGLLTPVAELEPVMLAGSRVSRATLHNRDEIARKDIRIGDFVALEKAGEIIPAVAEVNLSRRSTDSVPFIFPSTCPSCRTPVVSSPAEAAVRCPNFDCPAQLQRRLEFFVSKSGLGIEGLGPGLIGALVESGQLRTVADLYRLEASDLHLPGRKPGAAADRIMAGIARSKGVDLWRFIRALGIPNIGDATARELERRFHGLSALAAVRAEDLRGLSQPIQDSLLAHFERAENRQVIAELIAAGVDPHIDAPLASPPLKPSNP